MKAWQVSSSPFLPSFLIYSFFLSLLSLLLFFQLGFRVLGQMGHDAVQGAAAACIFGGAGRGADPQRPAANDP
jgi:hypothetical protein